MNENDFYSEETLRRMRERDERRKANREKIRKQNKRRELILKIAPKAIPALIGIVLIVVIVTAVSSAVKNAKLKAAESGEGDLTVSADTLSDNAVSENAVSENEPEPVIPENNNPYATSEPEKYGLFDGYTVSYNNASAYITNEGIISEYAVLIDADTGEVIAYKNPDDKMYPASMTKILSLLVAVENIKDEDLSVPVTISSEAVSYAFSHDCSSAGFEENETVTLQDLLYGAILPSGGEATYQLALYVAGSHEAFVDMMNDKSEELGISDTAHFTNCVGVYDDNQYCTVTDMAMILKAAVSNELCRQVLSAHIYTTSVSDAHPEGLEISNWFLRRIEDKDTHGEVLCAKTGYVDQSGNCAASYSIQNSGKQYILVSGKSWSAWRCIYDHVDIYTEYTN